MTLSSVLMRADASGSRGAGHVMRSVALAQELVARGAQVRFACASLTPFVRDRLAREGLDVLDVTSATPLPSLIQDVRPDWLVLDLGPGFDPAMVAEANTRVLVIDDTGQSFPVSPALVVNQNLHAATTVYRGISEMDVLRGPSYLLFRNEFLKAVHVRSDQSTSGILLVLGGTDPLRRLAPFADAISATLETSLHVVTSSHHPDLQLLRELARGREHVELHEDVTCMAQLMAPRRLAVTSGGTTVWELATLGVPAIVGSVAPIEDRLIAGLRHYNLFDIMDSFKRVDPNKVAARVRRRLDDASWLTDTAHIARSLIDGYGRRRVVDAMEKRT